MTADDGNHIGQSSNDGDKGDGRDQSNPSKSRGIVEDRALIVETDHFADEMVVGEIRSQHSEILAMVGTLSQRSGIAMAFSTLVLIELFDLESDSFLWWSCLVLILSSILIGLASLITGKTIPLGADLYQVVKTYNDGDYDNLAPLMFNHRVLAVQRARRNVDCISLFVLLQTVTLVGCMVLLVALGL